MANITTQAEWNNQYEGGNTLFIEDTDATGLVVTGNNVDIEALEGSIVQCRNLGLSRAAPNSSLTMNNCTVFLRDQGGAGASGDLASGTLNITNSILTYSRTGGSGFEWPGYESGATDRPILNLRNTVIRAPAEGGALGSNQRFRMNFQGLAGAGHDFTNTEFGSNIAITFFPTSIPWVGVKFSDTTQTIVGVTQYARFDGAASNFGRITARWEGFFGCDFTNWTNPSTGSNADMGLLTQGNGQAGGGWKPGDANTATDNRGHIYMFDNDYARDDFTIRSRNNLSVPHIRLIKGVSWFPRLRDSASFATVNDGVVSIGGFTYLQTQASEDRSTLLTEVGPGGDGNNYIDIDANFRGMVFLEDEVVQNAVLANSVSVDTNQARPANLNFWSYLLDTFQADGAAGVIQNTQAGSWSAPCVLDTSDRQNIDVAADPFLNGRTQAQATALISSGVTDALDVYPAMKALGVQNRQSQNFLHTVTNGGYNSGARGFRFAGGSGNMRSDHGTLYIIRTPNDTPLTGRWESGGIIAVNEGSVQTSATFVAAGDIDLGGMQLMDGATLTAAGNIRSLPTSRNTAFTITDNNTIQYNFGSDQVINFATAYPNATFGTGITINNVGAGTLTVRNAPTGAIAGTNVAFATSITISGGIASSGEFVNRVQIFHLTDDDDAEGLAPANGDDILSGAGANATYPFVADSGTYPVITQNSRFRLVWTRPGYQSFSTIIGPITDNNVDVMINPVLDANANLTDTPATATLSGAFDRTDEALIITVTQGSTIPNNPQTNNLFERLKSQAAYGEAVAKVTNAQDNVQLISHTGRSSTTLVELDTRLAGDASLLQHSIGYVEGASLEGEGTSAKYTTDRIEGTLIYNADGTPQTPNSVLEVLIGDQTEGATYAEVEAIVDDGVTAVRTNLNTGVNLSATATENVRVAVDTELRRGPLTNAGRPPQA